MKPIKRPFPEKASGQILPEDIVDPFTTLRATGKIRFAPTKKQRDYTRDESQARH
jgi:hypothetical protein